MKHNVTVRVLAVLAGAFSSYVARVSSVAPDHLYRSQTATDAAVGGCCPAALAERVPVIGPVSENPAGRQNPLGLVVPALVEMAGRAAICATLDGSCVATKTIP